MNPAEVTGFLFAEYSRLRAPGKRTVSIAAYREFVDRTTVGLLAFVDSPDAAAVLARALCELAPPPRKETW